MWILGSFTNRCHSTSTIQDQREFSYHKTSIFPNPENTKFVVIFQAHANQGI